VLGVVGGYQGRRPVLLQAGASESSKQFGSKPRSTDQVGVLSGALTRKVPSEPGEWELLTLP
jgi:hypothetical protein